MTICCDTRHITLVTTLRDNMASLCSVTSSKKILKSYRRRRYDDRPFAKSNKAILPIRGFKGNRILYGDSLDAVNEVTEEEEEDYDEDDDKFIEPLYSEPQFELCAAQFDTFDRTRGTCPTSHVEHLRNIFKHVRNKMSMLSLI